MRASARLGLATLGLLVAAPAAAEEVGRFSVDWVSNDVVIEALEDPKVDGITCHVTRFERGLWDRVTKGDWFEDPSNASISCRQTGPLVIGDIERDENGEEVFSDRISLVFKALAVRRIFDEDNQTLIYVVHSRQVTEGSAKMAVSTVALHDQDVTWAE
jgi:CreA protein